MSYGHIFQALELNFSIFSFECYVLVFKSIYEKKKDYYSVAKDLGSNTTMTYRRNCQHLGSRSKM